MSMDHGNAWRMLGSMRKRGDLGSVPKGTWRRVFRFATPFRGDLVIFLLLIVGSAGIGVITPVLAGRVVNDITRHAAAHVVIDIALVIAGLAVIDAGLSFASAGTRPASARVSSTTCAPRCSVTSSACRWRSSPGPRPAR